MQFDTTVPTFGENHMNRKMHNNCLLNMVVNIVTTGI